MKIILLIIASFFFINIGYCQKGQYKETGNPNFSHPLTVFDRVNTVDKVIERIINDPDYLKAYKTFWDSAKANNYYWNNDRKFQQVCVTTAKTQAFVCFLGLDRNGIVISDQQVIQNLFNLSLKNIYRLQ